MTFKLGKSQIPALEEYKICVYFHTFIHMMVYSAVSIELVVTGEMLME